MRWLKNDLVLEGEFCYEFFLDDDMYFLELINCFLFDVGMYCCIVVNEVGEIFCSVEFDVMEKFMFFVFIDELLFLNVIEDGGNILLEVNVSGKFILIVEWVKDDVILKNSSYFNIKVEDDKYILIIVGVGFVDFGIYKCIVNN